MDSQVQILQVTVRNTRTGRAVYDVACGDGEKRTVWEAGIANGLNALVGQVVTIREEVKQNGQYTNRTITAFAPPGQQLPPDASAQLAPVGGLGTPLAGGAVQPIQQAPQGGARGKGQYPPEVTTRITKLASYEYATTLVGSLLAGAGPEAFEQAIELTDQAAKHFYTKSRSHEKPAVDPQQAALAAAQAIIDAAAQAGTLTTPAAVAAVVPGVEVGAPVETVAAAQDAAAEQGDDIQWD